jgi:virulence-associated protein VapD
MDETTKTLIDLLRRVERLGLTFSRGSAYISVSYIEEQEQLRAEIAAAIAAAEAPR